MVPVASWWNSWAVPNLSDPDVFFVCHWLSWRLCPLKTSSCCYSACWAGTVTASRVSNPENDHHCFYVAYWQSCIGHSWSLSVCVSDENKLIRIATCNTISEVSEYVKRGLDLYSAHRFKKNLCANQFHKSVPLGANHLVALCLLYSYSLSLYFIPAANGWQRY